MYHLVVPFANFEYLHNPHALTIESVDPKFALVEKMQTYFSTWCLTLETRFNGADIFLLELQDTKKNYIIKLEIDIKIIPFILFIINGSKISFIFLSRHIKIESWYTKRTNRFQNSMQNLIIEIILTFNFSNSLIRSNSFHHCAFNFDFLSFPLFKSRNCPIFLFSVLSLFIDVCFSIFFFFFF